MDWIYTLRRVKEYAWRHGYIVRPHRVGYYWTSVIDPERLLGVGTLREAATWIRSRVAPKCVIRPPSIAELEGEADAC